ncbi:CPBP family intramembrane metalloprotease [Paenibacillus motobuensis]|uniref:CPBP family intramembrane glutamic endopeptidase n=1 Tax=Paenibacillus TaxID=44249 RepID=UPI00203B5496|nr:MULTISPECIES: CPBP family intramembrane glutamic endopeptidase [Paenibacillus]MCM3038918.1 CPBP family intramembrane metalloprotease [Paenibacillus lutimineralis]MCM3646022.1 CPBP family intramembrane metalloprotease [Paenibacillus motobuensis]
MNAVIQKTKNFFNLSDPEYVQFLKQHEAKDRKSIAFYLLLGLLPGVGMYFLVYHFRETFMAWTGLSAHYTQFVLLALAAAGWHTLFPFFMLKFVDKLTFKESLRYLGFTRLDLKGLLTVVPIIIALFTLLSLPYMKYVFPPINAWLDAIPWLHMGEWHIFYLGYYDFPWYLLVIGVFGNFVGEEIYFRGYLLRKVGSLKYDWLVVSFLFQVYHMWQAPMNWAFILLSIIIPHEILVKLRKNIYGAIVYHLFANTIWGAITLYLVGV